MKTAEFLLLLKAEGIKVWAEAGALKLSARKGALTPELKQQLMQRKEAILAALDAASRGASTQAATPGISALPRDVPLPLSFAQQRLWFMQQLDPELVAYNLPLAWRVRGALDLDLLERALGQLAQRHESLHTCFVEYEGLPAQLAQDPAPKLTLQRLARGPQVDQAAWQLEMASALTTAAETPFDLERGPLLRCMVIEQAEADHILQLVVHHIVFDGVSIEVFARELKALYDARLDPSAARLEPLVIQYADFASWQAESFAGGEFERQLGYWREALAGELPILELPTDWARPALQTFRGDKVYLSIEGELFRALEASARRENVTLYMLLLAAYKLLLHRFSGLDDVIVGTAVDGRPLPEVEATIGFFVNTLALRSDLSGDPSLRALLQRVRATCLAGFEHKDMPFERLVDELQPERNLSYSPIFQALFFHELTRSSGAEASGAAQGLVLDPNVAVEGYEFRAAKNDLALWVSHDERSLRAWFEYNRDLFAPARMQAMMDCYRRILEALAGDLELRLSRVPMLTSETEELLLEVWNATDAAIPKDPIHVQFESQVDLCPTALALCFAGLDSPAQRYSYLELDQAANRLAWHCIALGVKPGGLVGLSLDRSAEMVIAQLAIQKCGAAYVPLDPSYPSERLSYMVEHSGLAHVITLSELESALPATAERILLDRDKAAILACSDARPKLAIDAHERIYVIYTSGSTGRPKGVELEHHSVSNFLACMAREPGFGPGMGLLAVTTLSFDISVLETMLPLVTGGHVIVAPREALTDATLLMRCIEEHRPAMMQATPSTWRLLTLAGWQGDPELRALIGGEALPEDLARQLVPLCAELWNMYGPTETTIWSSLKRIQDPHARITIGRPIANTQFFVLGAHGELLPPGVSGELWIAGDGLARGYLKSPELSAMAFQTHPYHSDRRIYRSGDRARWTSTGEIECLGRIDSQIKLRGFRIELGEIEATIAELDGVAQCACLVREDTPGDQRLFAYWVAKHPPGPEESQLRIGVQKKLPAYMLPSAFVRLESLPTTPNGKLDKQALLKLQPSSIKLNPEQLRQPQGALQVELHAHWCAVLKLDQLGVDGNFFDLGGHSLLLAQVHARLRKAHPELKLSIIELFQYPSIETLAAHMQAKAEGQSSRLPEQREATLAKGRQALMRRRKPRT